MWIVIITGVIAQHNMHQLRLSQAKQKLSQALVDLWKLEDELGLPDTAVMKRLQQGAKARLPGQNVSLARQMDDSLMKVFQRAQLGGAGATCLDWDAWPNYMSGFSNCATKYQYDYDANARLIDAKGRRIVGDLKDLSFVPAGLFDLVVCSAVFEHVPQFWWGAATLSHLVKAGGVVIFGVPFFMRTHMSPFDFWRFTFMGASYLIESHGFEVCMAFTDGERSAQLQTLGLANTAFPLELLNRGSPSTVAGLIQASTYTLVAVKRQPGQKVGRGACASLPPLSGEHLMSSISKKDFKSFHGIKRWVERDAGEGLVRDKQ